MDSIKILITEYLKDKGIWIFGGMLEDYIRSIRSAKASNASRRCRELVREEKIERQIVNFAGRRVVQYKWKPPIELPPAYKPKVEEKTMTLGL